MKRKKKKNNYLSILTILTFILYTISNIHLIINIFLLNNIENLIRIIILLSLIIINIFITIILFKKKKRKITCIISIILAILNIFLNYNFNKIYKTLNNVTVKYEEHTLSLITLKENNVNNINEIDDDIGVIKDETIANGYNFAKEIITEHKIKYNLIKYDSYEQILTDLYNNKIKYAFLPDNYKIMFANNENFSSILDKFKIISNEIKKEKIEEVNKDINTPFTILLMGVDTLTSSYNADTLLVVTFNPETLKATMLSIPRDTYTTISCTKGKHKINSSGWYSDKCVTDTVGNLLDIKIDYYAKINFTGIVDLVDKIGGINVDVVYSFCEQNSKREFGNNIIYVEEGNQNLNGEQALALSRNRHFYYDICPSKYNEKGYYNNNLRNDITRGLNQQLVLKGILNKLTETKNLSIFYDLLEVIGDNITTNMDKNTMLSFYNIFKNIVTSSNGLAIDEMIDIEKLSIEVYGTYVNISNLNLSMIIPHQNSINAVSNAMKENLGLKEKNNIKTLSFDINNPYEEKIIGKNIYGGTTLSLLEDLTGKDYDYAVNYCNKINYTCNYNYIEITDDSYNNNEIIAQNIPGNYDMSLIYNKQLTLDVAKIKKTTTPTQFDYKQCVNENFKDNKNCIIPSFTNKSIEEFNKWYKNFGYIQIKLTNNANSEKENNTIVKQNLSNISIYELTKNNKILEIEYIKNEEKKDNNQIDNNKEEEKKDNNNDTSKEDNNKEDNTTNPTNQEN